MKNRIFAVPTKTPTIPMDAHSACNQRDNQKYGCVLQHYNTSGMNRRATLHQVDND